MSDQASRNTVQSLTRGLAIVEALARHGEMTATELAKHLGVHQSSVSRLLASLVEAGLVRKPRFHGFSLDFGILRLAGTALANFPIVAVALDTCLAVRNETGWGAAVGILNGDRLIYLAMAHGGQHPPMPAMVDSSDFPLHNSSLALALLHADPERDLAEAARASHERMPDAPRPMAPEALAGLVAESIEEHGFLYLRGFLANRFNAARVFDSPHGPVAFAVFSPRHSPSPERVDQVLREGIGRIEEGMLGAGR